MRHLWMGLLPLFACATSSTHVGRWDQAGFHRHQFRYSLQGDGAQILPGWTVDNWQWGTNLPRAPQTNPDNWTNHRYDATGDGRTDFVYRLPSADVVLRHDATGAVLWIQLVPIEPRRHRRRMRVVLRDWIRSVSGTRYAVHSRPGTTTISERRWTTNIIRANPARVLGYTAAAATFEVADVDRLQLAPESRDLLGRAVLIATPFVSPARPYRRQPELRIALMVALLAHPDDFDELTTDLQRLVDALEISSSAPGSTETAGVLTDPRPAPAPAPALARPVVVAPVAPPIVAPPVVVDPVAAPPRDP